MFHSIGIQEVAGLILGLRFGHDISAAILSLLLIQVGQLCYCRKYGQFVLVNRLGSLPGNSVIRLTDWLDITLC